MDAANQRSAIARSRILERRRTSSVVDGTVELVDRRDQAWAQGPVGARRGASERSREAGSIGGERRGSVCVRSAEGSLDSGQLSTRWREERLREELEVGHRTESRARRTSGGALHLLLDRPKSKRGGLESSNPTETPCTNSKTVVQDQPTPVLLSLSQTPTTTGTSSLLLPLRPSSLPAAGHQDADSRVGLLQSLNPDLLKTSLFIPRHPSRRTLL